MKKNNLFGLKSRRRYTCDSLFQTYVRQPYFCFTILVLYCTASAALAAMSSSQISKDSNCKNTPPEPVTEPGLTCEVLLEAERQRCEQEKFV